MPRYCFTCGGPLDIGEYRTCGHCRANDLDGRDTELSPICPSCFLNLEDQADRLVCTSCGYSYDIGGE